MNGEFIKLYQRILKNEKFGIFTILGKVHGQVAEPYLKSCTNIGYLKTWESRKMFILRFGENLEWSTFTGLSH